MSMRGKVAKNDAEKDWREVRRETVRRLTSPIIFLAQEAADIKEKRAELAKAKQELPPELNDALRTYEDAIVMIAVSAHLTIGSWSCQCAQCKPIPITQSRSMPWDIVRYDKTIHKSEEAFGSVRRGQLVIVTSPFIGDNILREVVQPVLVAPLSKAQPGRRYRSQYLRKSK